MCMAISGGAIVPLVMGQLVDLKFGPYAFVVPAACFAYLLLLSLRGGRNDAIANPSLSTLLRKSKESASCNVQILISRIVMTLDAGGTNLKFSAIRGERAALRADLHPDRGRQSRPLPGEHRRGLHAGPVADARRRRSAISFAFPGPADYPAGIIGDLRQPARLPRRRGPGADARRHFGMPVFINNDGDLFVYGEAIAGFLPYVNGLLEEAGSPKRYKNLFGVTLGTGFGGGIVRDGELFIGDNSVGGEIWLLRNKLASGGQRRGRGQHPRRAPRLCRSRRAWRRRRARAEG